MSFASQVLRRIARRAALATTATIVTALILELLLRTGVERSPEHTETSWKIELRPAALLTGPDKPVLLDPHGPVIMNGMRLSRADLWGSYRLDPVLGYTHQERFRSQNDWWQSNDLGARSRKETSPDIPAGRHRILVFGDSFAQGHMLRQEETWPAVIEASRPPLEVLNFAVDGYGIAQSYLRFAEIRTHLKYDTVLMLFAPEADLWRDVNVLRQLDDPRWQMIMMPRFELADENLTLIRPLYADPLDLFRKNRAAIQPELRDFLRAHDRLYFPPMYEGPAAFRDLVLYRLLAQAAQRRWRHRLDEALMTPGSEALRVCRSLFRAMQEDTHARGASFVLLLLPTERHWWDPGSAQPLRSWRQMAAYVCEPLSNCVDLLPQLGTLPAGAIDWTFDNWHFGAATNRRLAALVVSALEQRGGLPPSQIRRP